MELIEWLQKISILNIFIINCQVLLGFEITDTISFGCEKEHFKYIWRPIFPKKCLSSGQCFSINTKSLQGEFSRRNMEGCNNKRFEKMNMQNALCGTFWL